MKNNIVLIGFMGSGKTTVGRILARELKVHFADSDQMIEEKEAVTIPDIFKRFGEAYFRELEYKTIRSILKKDNTVVSTGGGAVLNKDLLEYMKYNARVVHLEASVETLWNRIKNCTNRPMLYSDNPRKRMEELYKERLPIYRKAHYNIITDCKKPIDVAKEIIQILKHQT